MISAGRIVSCLRMVFEQIKAEKFQQKEKEAFTMSIEKVKNYFEQYGLAGKVMEFEVSSATVELAAEALHTQPGRIAKTLSFLIKDGSCILVVMAGDKKVDNSKFKAAFGTKAKMPSPDEVLEKVGHSVGGVCPFAIPDNVKVYLDESLKEHETVFPACGSSNSAIELTCNSLYQYAKAAGWVDIGK